MSEITSLILEGLLCTTCGEVVDGYCTDYPRLCKECEMRVKNILDKAEERNKKTN